MWGMVKKVIHKICLFSLLLVIFSTTVYAGEVQEVAGDTTKEKSDFAIIDDLEKKSVAKEETEKRESVTAEEEGMTSTAATGTVEEVGGFVTGEEKIEVIQKNNTEYKITLSETAIPVGTKSVKIPIWSVINGQDDIRWYDAKRQSDGSYTVDLKLENHKGLGEYFIHAYVVMNDDKYVCVATRNVVFTEPLIENVSISNFDIVGGTFRVMLSGITGGDMIKRIQVPVWSTENGQDDIQWYEAKKNDSGEFYVDINIMNHKYSMGIYNVHVYITDITDYRFFAGLTQQEVAIEEGSLTIVKNSEKEYTIQLKDMKMPSSVTQVQFPTWSVVNGQDDIQWYTVTKAKDGSFKCKISLTNHKGLGEFMVHAYAKMPNGSLVCVGKNAFETETPSIGEIESTVVSKENGQFQVKVSGIKNDSLIKQIQIPIWSTSNQSDIVWYMATKNKEGDYVVNADIANHRYNCGNYNIHVYMTDITGCMQYMGKTICDMQPEYDNLSVEDISGTESSYRVTLTGVKVPSGVKQMQFAVWGTSGGQNDIRWYTAVKQSDGSYIYDIKIANHKELGKYNVHIYGTTKGNTLQFIGSTGFEVSAKPTVAQVQVSDVNGTTGTFKITVKGLMAPSGVTMVQIPIWCAADQSDIVWYTATKSAEGVYTVIAKVSNHGHHFGDYKVHVYATMGNGIRCFVESTIANIQPVNYVYSVALNSTQREVGVMGVTNVSRVQFPTWSDTNGQDDIVWYEGINRGNGKWNTVVDTVNHNSGGAYTTHVYTTVNGNLCKVGSATYSLSKVPTAMSQMAARANLYSSSTPYLILVNRSTHKVGVFQGRQGNWNCIQYWDCSDGAPSTPTVEGTFRVGSRGYYFDSGSSRCYWYTQFYGNYLFHSVLYSKYNGSLVDGRLGMPLSHGCVRLHINNAKWIYDTIPSGTTVVVYH